MSAPTILHARRKRLTKTYGRDPNGKIYKTTYDKPLLFTSQSYPVANIGAATELLHDLERAPDCCVILAAPSPWHPGPGQPVRRLLDEKTVELVNDAGRYRKPAKKGSAAVWEAAEIEAGRLRLATLVPMFVEQPTDILPLDFDRAFMPDGIEWRADLHYTAEFLRRKLPPEFHDARAAFYATGSAADLTQPDLGGAKIKMRLVFMLDQCTVAAQNKRWLAKVDGLDPCTLNAAQVIYTAAPRYLDGLSDPLPWRLGGLGGRRDRVAVPALPKPPKREKRIPVWPPTSAEGWSLAARHPLLDAAVNRITGDAGTVRGGLMQCAFAYADDVGRDHVDIDALVAFLTEIGERFRSQGEVDDYGLERMVGWALDRVPVPAELTADELALLRQTVARAPVAREIWTAKRTYRASGKAHFALAASLARAGLRHHETLERVLRAYDRRHGGLPTHPDYARRTIAAALESAR